MARSDPRSPYPRRRLRRIRFCYRGLPPFLVHHPSPDAFVDEAALSTVRELHATAGHLNASTIIAAGEPQLLSKAWRPAYEPAWTWKQLGSLLRGETLDDAALTNEFHYAPIDASAALSPFVHRHLSTAFATVRTNLSAETVVEGLGMLETLAEQLENGGSFNAEPPRARAARRRAFWRES